MLPITQVTAGWVLIVASTAVCAAVAVLRALVRRNLQRPKLRTGLMRVRGMAASRMILGEPGHELTDEDVDAVTLLPGLYAALAIFLGGVGLVAMDGFGIYLQLFTLEG